MHNCRPIALAKGYWTWFYTRCRPPISECLWMFSGPIWRRLGPVSWICGLVWGRYSGFLTTLEWEECQLLFISNGPLCLFLCFQDLKSCVPFHSIQRQMCNISASYFQQQSHIDRQTHGRWETSSPAVSFAVVWLSTNQQTAKDKCTAMQAFVLQLYTCH